MNCLLAYDETGLVVATLDTMVARNYQGEVVGLIDFAAHEANGGQHTDIWQVPTAVGSKVWPEFLGARAHEFRVELEGEAGHKRIGALVHIASGHRRERHQLEYAVATTPVVKGQRDIRHLVGGPSRHLALDEHGRTVRKSNPATPSHLPLIGR